MVEEQFEKHDQKGHGVDLQIPQISQLTACCLEVRNFNP